MTHNSFASLVYISTIQILMESDIETEIWDMVDRHENSLKTNIEEAKTVDIGISKSVVCVCPNIYHIAITQTIGEVGRYFYKNIEKSTNL